MKILKPFFSFIYQWGGKKIAREILPFIKRRGKVLDLGCGSGFLGKEVEILSNSKVLGLDVDNFLLTDLEFLIFDGKRIPFPDNTFDVVLIVFVLHHTSDPIYLLREARRVGKKIIVLEDLIEGKISYFRCKLHLFFWELFYGQKLRKFNFFSEKEWETIFHKCGLSIVYKREIKIGSLDPVRKKFFVLERLKS
mgnify:CR=1 FL=1